MAIVIRNISEDNDLTYGSGKQMYFLAINYARKCTFTHNFEDGLSECLRRAADAFDAKEKKDGHQDTKQG